jgi:hypothetical protein
MILRLSLLLNGVMRAYFCHFLRMQMSPHSGKHFLQKSLHGKMSAVGMDPAVQLYQKT